MKLLRSFLAAVLWLPVASGCTSKDEQTATAAAETAEAGGVETIEIPARDPPKVEVQATGDEPRRPLRLRPAAGTHEVLDLTVDMRMAMSDGVRNVPPVPVPTTKTRFRADIDEVGADGVMAVRQAVESVEVTPAAGTPPAVLEQVRKSVEPLENYRATMKMDDRGAIRGGQVQLPRNLPAMVHQMMQQMTESLGQLSAPLPLEAVGPGARWTSVHEIRQSGMKLRQVGSYTLVSLDGEHAVIEATIAQELLDPNISAPGMMGVTARVSDFASSGRGTVELDLDRLMPRQVSLTMSLKMTMDMTVLGQAQHMEMAMDMDMGMRRGEQR